MKNPAIDDIKNLFNIDKGSDKGDDYGTTAEDDADLKPSFEELADEMCDRLVKSDASEAKDLGKPNPKEKSKEPEKTEDTEALKDKEDTVVEEESKATNEEVIRGSVAKNVDIGVDGNIDIDSIFDAPAEGTKTEVVESKEVEGNPENQSEQSSERPVEAPVSGVEPSGKSEQEQVEMAIAYKELEGDTKWLIQSPTPKYNDFYEKKREDLPFLLPGGQIPFDKFLKELRSSHIHLNLHAFDQGELCSQLVKIGGLKNRVAQIILDINNQYFRWKRYMELFHGVLARCEYEKPVIRQNGVIYEHMRDFEEYFERLEGIYHSANMVYKNLDGAFEIVSRQISIVRSDEKTTQLYSSSETERPAKNIEIEKLYSSSETERPARNIEIEKQPVRTQQTVESKTELSDELDGFDTVDKNAVPPPPKGAAVGWDIF